MQRLEFRAMGCQMLAVLDVEEPVWSVSPADHGNSVPAVADRELLSQVPHWFGEWEQVLSRFRQDSELNWLNRSAGRPVKVSPVLWEVTHRALRAARESDGLVVPTLLNALEAAGYDRSFEALKRGPLTLSMADPEPDGGLWHRGHERLSEAPADRGGAAMSAVKCEDWRAIQCDRHTRSITLPRGLRLDFGGIAKGWAADQAARRLGVHQPALVDAGGDIAVSGPRADGEAWPIGVADPLAPDTQFELLRLCSGGVATSGRDYRRWQHNGAWQHHIIDPRTGYPAQTDVLSATVVAPTAVMAEVAAKVVLILGSRDGLAWLEERPALAGLLILDDGRVLYSRRLNRYRWG